MSVFCEGIDNKGNKCHIRIHDTKKFCMFHRKKHIIKYNIQLPKQIILEDCPICLCEIERNEEDPGLICNHKFHINCLNQLHKQECPVCRGPLIFKKSTKVDINKIKNKEEQEKLKNERIQIAADTEFSRTLQNRRNNFIPVDNLEDMIIMMLMMEDMNYRR